MAISDWMAASCCCVAARTAAEAALPMTWLELPKPRSMVIGVKRFANQLLESGVLRDVLKTMKTRCRVACGAAAKK